MVFGFAQPRAGPVTRPVVTRALGYVRAPSRVFAGGRAVAAPADGCLAAERVLAPRHRGGRRRALGLGELGASLLLHPRSRMDREAPSKRRTGAAKWQPTAPLRTEATCTTAQARARRRDGSPSGSAPSGSRRGRCRGWCSRRLSKFSATNSAARSLPRWVFVDADEATPSL